MPVDHLVDTRETSGEGGITTTARGKGPYIGNSMVVRGMQTHDWTSNAKLNALFHLHHSGKPRGVNFWFALEYVCLVNKAIERGRSLDGLPIHCSNFAIPSGRREKPSRTRTQKEGAVR